MPDVKTEAILALAANGLFPDSAGEKPPGAQESLSILEDDALAGHMDLLGELALRLEKILRETP